MSICANCNATPADFFSDEGDVVCRRCFAAGDQLSADARAHESLADTGIAGVRYSTEPQSAKGALLAGALLLALGVGPGLGLLLLTGALYFWFILIAGAGVASLARGVMLLRR